MQKSGLLKLETQKQARNLKQAEATAFTFKPTNLLSENKPFTSIHSSITSFCYLEFFSFWQWTNGIFYICVCVCLNQKIRLKSFMKMHTCVKVFDIRIQKSPLYKFKLCREFKAKTFVVSIDRFLQETLQRSAISILKIVTTE